jgi:hypothetical protein
MEITIVLGLPEVAVVVGAVSAEVGRRRIRTRYGTTAPLKVFGKAGGGRTPSSKQQGP